jgi:superfamily II DNA or RNA helicase
MPSISTTSHQPFPFQVECIQNIYAAWRVGIQKTLLVAGCGAGKTFIAGLILQEIINTSHYRRRCLFLVDRNKLLEQAYQELTDLGVYCSIFQGDRNFDLSAPVIIVSCQTLESRIRASNQETFYLFGKLFDQVNLIIADEAHLVPWRESYLKLEEFYEPQGTRFLGLTATPDRTKPEEYLGQRFQHLTCAPQPPVLIKLGRTVTCRSFGPEGVFDYRQLRVTKNGEYEEADLEAQALRPEAMELIINTWFERGQNRPTVALCTTVDHTQKLAEAFCAAGVAAVSQSGKTSIKDRDEQDKGLTNGSIKVICSVDTQKIGWNIKSLGCVIFTYATLSKADFFQGAGRGSRTDEKTGKQYYILLDFGGNVLRHGSPTGFQDYSIDPKPQKDVKRTTLKVCPNCSFTCSIFLSICPECSHVFTDSEDPIPQHHDLCSIPLVEMFSPLERQQIQFLRKAKNICYEHNLSPDVAIQQFIKRNGFEPYCEWHYRAVLGEVYTLQEKQKFIYYLQSHAPATYRSQWLSINIHLEFGDNNDQPIISNTQRTYPAWWEVLQISEDSTYEQAKAAYVQLSQPWQPTETQDPDAPFRIKQLNWAWSQTFEHFHTALFDK